MVMLVRCEAEEEESDDECSVAPEGHCAASHSKYRVSPPATAGTSTDKSDGLDYLCVRVEKKRERKSTVKRIKLNRTVCVSGGSVLARTM